MVLSATAALFAVLRITLFLTAGPVPVEAVPGFYPNTTNTNASSGSNSSSGSSYWLANIERQGLSAFNPNASDYQVFRNVKLFGAKGTYNSVTEASYNANRTMF